MSFRDCVSIVVPTFRRPEGLATALESLIAQNQAYPEIELIVTDNDPDGSAEALVARFAETSPFETIYVHAPDPGVANARNAALNIAKGRYIAFLDDDESASEGWLTEMLSVMTAHKCCAVFSRIIAQTDEVSVHSGFFADFFGREYPELEAGVIDHFYGCGSSLLDRTSVELPDPVFSSAMNETGGEDDVLFDYLHRRGGRMGWTRKAFAYEHVPAKRLTEAYIRQRSFAFGQGPTRMYVDLGPFDPVGMIRSMLIGSAQFLVYGLMAVAARLVKPSAYLKYLSKACMGAGKVFWQKRFRPGFYGVRLVRADT